MAVSDYILLTSFVKFHNVDQLLCNFCPICSCPSRNGQTVEQPNSSQQILVPDHHGHSVRCHILIRRVFPWTSIWMDVFSARYSFIVVACSETIKIAEATFCRRDKNSSRACKHGVNDFRLFLPHSKCDGITLMLTNVQHMLPNYSGPKHRVESLWMPYFLF